jgi:hypothetical protein
MLQPRQDKLDKTTYYIQHNQFKLACMGLTQQGNE